MSKQIPSILTAFSVYRNGGDYLGAADIELPSLELPTGSFSASGFLGEMDMPIMGQYGPMSVTINWKVLQKGVFQLARMESHKLDFRGSIQTYDTQTGKILDVPLKVSILAFPKSTSLGSLAPSSPMDSSNEMEVHYIKIVLNNKVVTEIDRSNYVCIIDEVDYVAQIRKNLAL